MAEWILGMAADVAVLDHAAAPRAVAAVRGVRGVLGDPATAWGVRTAALVHEDLEAGERAGEITLTGHEHSSLEASVLAMLAGLVTSQPFTPPAEALEQVRWAARQGLTLDAVLRAVWRSHSGVQRHVIEAMTSSVPADQLAAEVRRISAGLLDFVANLVHALSGVFEEESAAWGRHRSATIRRAVDAGV